MSGSSPLPEVVTGPAWVHAHLVPIGDQRLGVGEKDFGTWAEICGCRLTVLAVRDERVVAGSGVRPEVVRPAVEELGARPVLAYQRRAVGRDRTIGLVLEEDLEIPVPTKPYTRPKKTRKKRARTMERRK